MSHNHGGGEGESEGCTMDMSFHWGACEFILVKTWQADTVPKFVAACIGFFLLAILYEGLKYYREVLFLQTHESRQRVVKNENGVMTTTTVKLSVKQQMLNVPHFVQTILHLAQVFISYVLMLIIMLCNLWLILAICLGAAVGYFTFGWLRKVTYKDSTECCY